jgi:predicted DNA-binding protein YlxM (UPF0122 family)
MASTTLLGSGSLDAGSSAGQFASRRWCSPAPTTHRRGRHELFGQYGVSGTSLQMIAEHIGVTKAAVYHQFRTKEEIVHHHDLRLLVLERTVDAAEAASDTAMRVTSCSSRWSTCSSLGVQRD